MSRTRLIRSQSAVCTQADVLAMWRRHAPPPVRPRVCLVLLGPDGQPGSRVHVLWRYRVHRSPRNADRLVAFLEDVSGDMRPLLSWAILYCRPGVAPLNDHDRAVCRWIRDSAQRREVGLATLHVLTGAGFAPVTPDDLIAAS